MSEELLLPGEWSHLAPKIGVNTIQVSDFELRLFDSYQIDHAGVPSIFALAFGFDKALRRNPPDESARRTFMLLAQGLFLGIIEIRTHALNTKVKLAETVRKFEPDMKYFHTLLWQGRPVGALYHQCLLFPGAKFSAASAWRENAKGENPEPGYVVFENGGWSVDVTVKALEDAVGARLRLFGEDWVKALFRVWVNQVTTSAKIASGQRVLWHDLMVDIANNEWATEVVAPDDALTQFTKPVVEMALNGVDGVQVSIPLHVIQDYPFCEKVLGTTGGKYPDLPIKSHYLNLVDVSNSNCTPGAPDYQVQFKGWSGLVAWRASEKDTVLTDCASILLWPSFRAKGWRVNYIDIALSPSMDSGLKPSARLLDGSFKTIDTLENFSGGRISKVVDYVEIVLSTSDGKEIAAGVFRDNRSEQNRGGNATSISLDFGTTNTTIGTWDDRTGKYTTLGLSGAPHDLLGTGCWWDSKEPAIASRRDSSFFLPVAYDESGDNPILALPSELVFINADSKLVGDKLLDQPIAQYTIPHPNFQRERAYKMVVGNFKWTAPPNYNRWALVRAYLKLLLHMVLAQLRSKEAANKVEIVPTYPLAFGAGEYREFYRLLKGHNDDPGLLSEVSDETGVALDLAIVNRTRLDRVPVAESFAARESIAWSPSPGSAELVVDIGGGSTDIAGRLADVDYSESIPYGGNGYLRYLATNFADVLPIKGAKNNDVTDNMIALQTIVRRNGIDGVLESFPQNSREAAQEAIDRFFTGIFVYVYRLLKAKSVEGLNFYPLGNGWRLVESYLPPHNDIKSYIEKMLERWGVQANVVLPDSNDYKGAVCKGARRVVDSGTYVHPENIEVKTIVGGNVKVGDKLLSWDSPVPTGELGTSPLNFDCVDFVREFVSISNLAASETDIQIMAGKLAAACTSATRPIVGNSVGLNRSVMAVFLGQVFADRI